MKPRSPRIARLVPMAAAIGALAVLSTACASPSQEVAQSSQVSTQQSKYKGTELAVPTPIPPVTLTDFNGKPYDLKANAAGKLTLVYFGYTHCPDECPTTMADLASALRLLPADKASKVRVVFVTTDPDRDTGPVLKDWLAKFNPSFVGLTGTITQVDDTAKLAATPVSPPVKNPDGTIEVDHGTQVNAFGTDGLAHVVWLSDVTPKDIAHDISLLT
ncbi:electron transport protein SCO1/SenC [Catenulispora acidiphila DSM 44928]|uniref:Electron transport protein SCO1/SenC n=1 Tax=Catenulispora acidiphila (strain DSM 44928 / JCM 14897 / NBRC 102108 / NRRL B-24433 / ID139908) TaxID=479433 RepID=C7Q4K7_CATAD|nr:SCO family protein [Catenulispora acidiphila]ACU71976.1 electron transport protein SCO1/SenC [Catenulispora acidiphila DSM 44928]